MRAERHRVALIKRDGMACWYCGAALGEDATIEHLIARSRGGVNHLDNYALAHRRCNQVAADKSLVEKIAIRERMREVAA